MVCKQLVVRGVVQGVGFREATRREASRIGTVSGWVRNLATGDVEVRIQGDEAGVAALARWCRRGPPMAKVEEVTESETVFDPSISGFAILR